MLNIPQRLQSQHEFNITEGFQPLPDDPHNPLEIFSRIPLSGDLCNLDNDVLTTIFNRSTKFMTRYFHGEPRRNRDDTWYRKYINQKDIMVLHPTMPLPSAKRILENIRFFLQKPGDAKVTIKAYCYMVGENEEDAQMMLLELDEQRK